MSETLAPAVEEPRQHTAAATSGGAGNALRPLLLIIVAAVVVRALTSLYLPSVVYPDETFQLIEQADRIVTGHGLVPWEFQVGARSWLLPGLLVPLLAAGRALSSDPRVALGFVTAAMTAVSATCVWSAYVIGSKTGDRLAGLFAAGLVGLWSELVYFSPHVLADTVSGALLLGALAACAAPERPRRLFWGGLLLGAAFVVRIQLAPAIGLAGLMICGRDLRRYLVMGAGFAVPVAALGLVDWLTWGAPFQSVLVYLQVNGSGVADVFGQAPPVFYIGSESRIWGLAGPLVVVTAYFGAKRAPLPAITAAAIVLTFSLVAHKEPRFIYPALLLLFVLCGIGSAASVPAIQARVTDDRLRRATPIALAALWVLASACTAASPAMRPLWLRDGGVLRAFAAVNADPQSCGLALPAIEWPRTGRSRLRSDLELYPATGPESAYNYLLLFDVPAPAPAAQGIFMLKACYGPDGNCLYKRPGACTAGAPALQAEPPARVDRVLQTLRLAR